MKNVAEKKARRSGNDHPSGNRGGKKPAQPGREVHESPIQPAGRGRGAGRSPKIGSGGSVANGFLKTQFLPRHNAIVVPAGEESESELYRSLSLLCEFYGISVPETKRLGYPYNVTMALQSLRENFPKDKDRPYSVGIDVRGVDFVTVERNHELEHKLFYIGVQELYDYYKKNKAAAEVLLGVYCYLYFTANIDWHLDEGSFLYYHYLQIEEMLDEEVEETYSYDPDEMKSYQERKNDFMNAKLSSESIHAKMWSFHKGRRTLKSALKRFQPINEFEKKIKAIAEQFDQINTEYPKYRINFKSGLELEQDAYSDYEEEGLNYATTTTMDKCLSFIHNADMNTGISCQIEENVNIYLQECYYQDFPTIVRTFNENSDYKSPSLDFENRFFPLLEDLIDIIYDLPKCDTLNNILGDNL